MTSTSLMLPSAEESKAERLKRQQARFRDRGGAFVPSNSNPLVDILLARTVTGESPSKSRPKDVVAKRLSSSKARQSSPTASTLSEGNKPVAGRSKSKQPASRKRTSKTTIPEGGEATKPTTKRRGRPAKSSKKAPGTDFNVEEPPPNTMPTSTSKGKRKQLNNHTTPSTSDSNAKPTPRPKTKANPNTTKKVVEVLFSDDDQTLVEAPQAKSDSRRRIRHENDGKTDESAPLITERATLPVDNSKASSTKTTERIKGERIPGTARSVKKTLKDIGASMRDEGHAKTNAKKRSVLPEEADEEVGPPPTKKGRSKDAIEPEPMPVLRTIKDVDTEEVPETGGRRKGKGYPNRVVIVDGGDEQQPSKPKKRKKEEDNYEDRPRKVVKFVETGPRHSFSLKLKENLSGRRHQGTSKTSIKEELESVHPKLTAKPPLRTKTSTSKGPPREVLERIKASAARYLQCVDSEPDELDCLS